MKENRIESFITDNADCFSNLEPPAEAWKNISNELHSGRRIRIRKIYSITWKAAAAVLIFVSAWLANDYKDSVKMKKAISSTEITIPNPVLNELSDAEAYYTSQINNRQAELEKYISENPEIMLDLKKEFDELDRNKLQLKKDLTESNADEKVIEAIIESYRVKLEILEQMLNQLRHSTAGEEKPVEKSL
jgi:hypothetical protein